MKTILSIVLLFGSIVLKGQAATITQIRSVQDTVISGDSLDIRITYTLQTNINGFQVQVMLVNPSVNYSQFCLDKAANIVDTYPTDANGYTILKVKIIPSMGTGDARLYANANSGYVPFYIKPLSVVGIHEYDKNATIIKTEYYDIYGKEKPSTNEGLTIKVTTYSNGYQKKDKVMLLGN
ncbi:hypothetical protein UFOVP87_24 [uncultured Caudovirales phage]|uniref:Uncharacterized protein n=1 Tax=uncultured Caudovirales phage TaxID=2100421 RepID=A0A6J5L4J8_9CAUD|nr:hypothetical protein UFOVP87_24 [uncultured Caudovirales phage]